MHFDKIVFDQRRCVFQRGQGLLQRRHKFIVADHKVEYASYSDAIRND